MIPILISPETIWQDEIDTVQKLFEEGLSIYHLRKPKLNSSEVNDFMTCVSKEFHSRIVLHYHFELADGFGWRGFHFNTKNIHKTEKLRKFTKPHSFSAHSFEEVERLKCEMEYQFLSPIFDSIAKEGYQSNFTLDALKLFLSNVGTKVVALGGIKPQHWNILEDCGFYGAAVLGYIWNKELTVGDRIQRFKELSKTVLQ